MEKSQPYTNSLRIFIERSGYTFKEVAKKTSISQRTLYYWAAGQRVIPYQDRVVLSDLLGCTAKDLMPHYAPDMLQLTHDTHVSQEQGEMNKKRRELLYLLGIASGILVLPDVDWEKIDHIVSTPLLPDKAGLADLEAINYHYWRIYRASSTKVAALDGVLGQLKTLLGVLQTSHYTNVRKHLYTLNADIAQLAGEIFFDSNDYEAAQACYIFAADAAKEAMHYDLWACALIRNAFIPIYNTQYYAALPLLTQAEHIAIHGDTSLVTRYWVSAVIAEAHAGTGNLTACQRALDIAEKGCETQNGTNGGWLRFDGTRLPEQRGTCFVRLKQPELAQPALSEALAQHTAYTRRRGMVLNDLAQTALQQSDIEQACTYAHEVIEVALVGSSGVLKKGLSTLRMQLNSFSQMNTVKQLDQHLQMLV